eukprot:jgi/Tetstr1/453401/TSEL_040383.t1
MPDGEEPVVEPTLESLHADEEYLWMSCFGARMAALFVALDELLPYVPAASQDFTPYLARARNHAEAIDKAFRFRLAFLRRLNEVKRGAGVDEDVAVYAGVAAKVSTSDGVGRLSSELLELCEATFRLSQFAEFCHESENISPLEATTATVVRLRKGAASAANAIGVPLSHIRYQGGWATNSDVVLDYIDPNDLPSPGAWFFFGHIAPLGTQQANPAGTPAPEGGEQGAREPLPAELDAPDNELEYVDFAYYGRVIPPEADRVFAELAHAKFCTPRRIAVSGQLDQLRRAFDDKTLEISLSAAGKARAAAAFAKATPDKPAPTESAERRKQREQAAAARKAAATAAASDKAKAKVTK